MLSREGIILCIIIGEVYQFIGHCIIPLIPSLFYNGTHCNYQDWGKIVNKDKYTKYKKEHDDTNGKERSLSPDVMVDDGQDSRFVYLFSTRFINSLSDI